MLKEGFACFWIGKGDDRKTFNRILEYRIGEDGLGDFEACPFCLAAGIETYDPDLFGGRFWSRDLSLSLLFKADQALPQLLARWTEIPPSNCCVALYDYQYDGDILEFEIDGFRFQFLGCYEY